MKFMELFEGHSLPASKSKHLEPYTEMVKVSSLIPYREFTRSKPMWGEKEFEKLKADIKKRGILDPLVIAYYTGDDTAILTEGNHRLRAALELKLNKVPVRVVRYQSNGRQSGKRVKSVRGFIKDDPIQHIPGDLKPSQIGIK